MFTLTVLVLLALVLFVGLLAGGMYFFIRAYNSVQKRVPLLEELDWMRSQEWMQESWTLAEANARCKRYAFLVHNGL